MSLVSTIKRIGQPFDPRTGFYAISALLYIETYSSFSSEKFIENSKLNIEYTIVFLLCYFLFMHILSPFGRVCIVTIKLLLFSLIDKVFKGNVMNFRWTTELSEQDGYYSRARISDLAINAKSPILNELVRKCEQEEKKFIQMQNCIFSIAVLIPFNFFNGGILFKALSSFQADGIYVLGFVSILILATYFTAIKEFKVKLNPRIYEKMVKESNFDSVFGFGPF